ncbi:MAG: acyl-CoA thioesterase [Christensenellales bacterium]|jgi:acyl-CoA hydrolase
MQQQRIMKKVDDSYSEHVQSVTQGSLNGSLRLFGGQLLQWIDVLAAVVARRHCQCPVTTVAIDSLQFLGPAYANDTIVMRGKVTYVGQTSMEICVHSYVEHLDGRRKLINTAYFIMVALDENERPRQVPGLVLETDEQKADWEAGLRRYELRKQRRKEHF